MKIDTLVSPRYFVANNSKRQVDVRQNSNFSQTEPEQSH